VSKLDAQGRPLRFQLSEVAQASLSATLEVGASIAVDSAGRPTSLTHERSRIGLPDPSSPRSSVVRSDPLDSQGAIQPDVPGVQIRMMWHGAAAGQDGAASVLSPERPSPPPSPRAPALTRRTTGRRRIPVQV
jgi:hypothetical protein